MLLFMFCVFDEFVLVQGKHNKQKVAVLNPLKKTKTLQKKCKFRYIGIRLTTNRTEIAVNRTEIAVNRVFRFGLRFVCLPNRFYRLTGFRLTCNFGSVHGSQFFRTEKTVNRFSVNRNPG